MGADTCAIAVRYDIECLIEATNSAISREIGSICYLGPLRDFPPRHLFETNEFDASCVAGGGDAWQRLRREPELVQKVNRFLTGNLRTRYTLNTRNLMPELDAAAIERCVRTAIEKSAVHAEESATARVAEDAPPSEFETSSTAALASALQAELRSRAAGETLTELLLVDSGSNIEVSHRDVGMGISQLLPVIVNAVAAQQKLIAIEQPELHLHPALQAELGDVFIESALGPNKNTFLIETHSEHLILRILRRVRETSEGALPEGMTPILPEHVSVLYVEPGKGGSKVVHLPVNAEGDFDKPWPEGFFPERAKELF